MLDTKQALVEKILRFDIGDDSSARPFAKRLAKEQSWSARYTARVITEYKRFLALAATSDYMMTPSKAVDAAWHLHLTYTHSYWGQLCDDILGRPLHHHPSDGSPGEDKKFSWMYTRTLIAYEGLFGEPPPQDIWPHHDKPKIPEKRRDGGGQRAPRILILIPVAASVGVGGATIAGKNTTNSSDLYLVVGGIALLYLFLVIFIFRKYSQPGTGHRGSSHGSCYSSYGASDSSGPDTADGGGGSDGASCGSSCGGGGCGGGGCGGGGGD